MIPVREDPRVQVPTFASHPDDGCELAPACLRCELPKCQYDMTPIELHRLRMELRREKVTA